jgi:hypothetical protein
MQVVIHTKLAFLNRNLWIRQSFVQCSGIFFKLARCGYTLRVTSQAAFSPEYITPTQKNHDYYGIFFKLARCGYTLRVTSQAAYSPEYITPTQKNHDYY